MSNNSGTACSTRNGAGDPNSFLRKWLSAEPQLLETVLVGFFFFFPAWHKLGSSENREPQLSKCLHKIIKGHFLKIKIDVGEPSS